MDSTSGFDGAGAVRVRPPRRYFLLAGGVLCAAAACRTWQPAGPVGAGASTPAQVVATASGPDGRPVRLTTLRGDVIILLAPRMERDSIVGSDARDRARRAVALADVHRVEVYRIGAAATAGVVVAGALAALAALYLVVATQVSRGT